MLELPTGRCEMGDDETEARAAPDAPIVLVNDENAGLMIQVRVLPAPTPIQRRRSGAARIVGLWQFILYFLFGRVKKSLRFSFRTNYIELYPFISHFLCRKNMT